MIDVAAATIAETPALKARFADWYRFNPRLQEDAYLRWQFQSAPARAARDGADGTAATAAGALDILIHRGPDGAVLGCLGHCPFIGRDGAARFVGGWTHNWMAAPDVKGSGLALLAAFHGLYEHRFLLRLSGQAAAVFRAMRIPMLARLPRVWAIPDPEAYQRLRALAARPGTDALWPGAEAAQASAAALARAGGAAAFTDRLDPERDYHPGGWRGVEAGAERSGAYLAWRYLQAPKHPYRFFSSDNGFAVWRAEAAQGIDGAEGPAVVRLLEWTFPPEETGAALARLLAGPARGAALIDFHCTANVITETLTPFGFFPDAAEGAAPPDLFRPLHWSGGYAVAIDRPPHRTARSEDFSRWLITLGDSDLDRVKL